MTIILKNNKPTIYDVTSIYGNGTYFDVYTKDSDESQMVFASEIFSISH